MTRSHSRHLLLIATMLVASLFPLWVAPHRLEHLNDDTYITLTYAKSLAAGRGFVFNHPPATLGTTSPLLTLLVAAGAALLPAIDASHIAVFLTALCWGGIAWLFYLFRRHLDLEDWQAAVIGLVIMASGWVGFLGMEAYLFAFLLTLSMVLFYRRAWLLAGGGVGLLFLARGEGALVLPLLIASSLLWNRPKRISYQALRPALLILAGFLIPLSLWSIYAQLSFGRILPATLGVKMAQGQSGFWLSFPTRLLRWIPQWERQFAPGNLPILNSWWLLILLGLGYTVTKGRKWLLLLAWLASYTVAYSALQVAAYWWYQLPILFVLQILAALGLIQLAQVITGGTGSLGTARQITATTLIVLTLFLLVRPRINQVLAHAGDSRAPSYLALCQWIEENTRPSQSIAYVEVGYLGYFTDNRIIDLMGLTTPDIASHIARRDFAWGFWHHEPDYFVYRQDFDWALGQIRADPRFEHQYDSVATLPGPGEADFIIYAHQ
jgi:hypothetical protein